MSYSEALVKSGLDSLKDRRTTICKNFMKGLKQDNPLFCVCSKRSVTPRANYSLRARADLLKPALCHTKRIADFVTVKFFHDLNI